MNFKLYYSEEVFEGLISVIKLNIWSLNYVGEGNGNLLQYSFLEDSMTEETGMLE